MSSWTEAEKCHIPDEIRRKEEAQACKNPSPKVMGILAEAAAQCIKPPEPGSRDILLVVDRLRRLAHDVNAYPGSVLFTAADLLAHDHMLQMKLDAMSVNQKFWKQEAQRLEALDRRPAPSITELSAEIVRLNQFVQVEQGRVARQRGTIEHLQGQVFELQKRLATIKECACG